LQGVKKPLHYYKAFPQALVLTPTRELGMLNVLLVHIFVAAQVHQEAEKVTKASFSILPF
jgi:hypothetical protein